MLKALKEEEVTKALDKNRTSKNVVKTSDDLVSIWNRLSLQENCKSILSTDIADSLPSLHGFRAIFVRKLESFQHEAEI